MHVYINFVSIEVLGAIFNQKFSKQLIRWNVKFKQLERTNHCSQTCKLTFKLGQA